MSRKTPAPLRGQAETAVAAAEAAWRWFRSQDASALTAVRTARLRARGWRAEAVAAMKRARGRDLAGSADISFSLREAVEHAASAVSDAALWELGADAEFEGMAEGLVRGARALARASDAAGAARAAALDDMRRWCADVERRRRAARAAAAEAPAFVDSVKRGEIAARLSSAAEALQQACDALAGSLAG
jgi:hypothetical protein